MAFRQAHDPRVHIEPDNDVSAPEHYVLADGLAPNFETYLFYAREQRDKEAAEARREGQRPPTGWLSELFGLDYGQDHDSIISGDEKKGAVSDEAAILTVSDAEYRAASGSLRTATWGAIFYLITTGTTWSLQYCILN